MKSIASSKYLLTSSGLSAALLLAAQPASAAGETITTNQVAGPGKTAAAKAATKPAASAGLVNDWLRQQSPAFKPWDIGGEFRLRYADSEGAVAAASLMTSVPASGKPQTTPVNPNTDFIAHGKANASDEILFRERLHIGYTPVSWLTVFGEFQSATESWDQRSPSPDQNEADLYQANVTLGNAKIFPVTLKVGRQELLYGDQRVVGVGNWNNTGRSFDAVKLHYVGDGYWVDAFSGNVVVPYAGHFDEHNDYDWFSGLYASTDKLVPWQESQAYVLARNASAGAISASALDVPGTPTTARDLYTFGFRFKSLPGKLGGWDYSLEAAGQLGSIYNSTLKKRLDQQAYALFAGAGYTWEKLWAAPRLGLGYEGGSGDSNSKDGISQTFDNQFGSNHAFYGQMDLFCARNMHIPRVSASLKPLKGLTVTLDYLWYVLADTHDSLYPGSGSGRNSNGYGVHPNYDAYVGSELDLIASYAIKPWANLQAGYGHFFAGDYIKESVGSIAANGGAVDANWVYTQLTFKF